MILVYIAAPCRGLSQLDRDLNRHVASLVGAWVNEFGQGKLFAIVPHDLTCSNAPKVLMSDKYWLEGLLDVALKCPYLLYYGNSKGVQAEVEAHSKVYPNAQRKFEPNNKSVRAACEWILENALRPRP